MSPRRRNGEGSIAKRKDGRWIGQLRLPDGRRTTIYGASPEEVRVRLTKLQRETDLGLVFDDGAVSVGEYLRRWHAEVATPSVRPMTAKNYALNIRRLDALIGHIRLSELRPATVQAAYATLSKSGLGPRSVRQAHVVLHRALKQAVAWELIYRNAAAIARPPRIPETEMSALTAEQLGHLLRSTRGQRLHALWALLGTTGLRIGEALGLKWSDVDMELGRIRIQRALQRAEGGGFAFVEPKTRRSRRVIQLAAGTRAALRSHRAEQQADREGAHEFWDDSNGDLVFTTSVGRPMEAGLVNWSLKKALRAAGLPRIRVHDLRHTAASVLLERGVHPKVVQEMLGHSTISLTLDTYSHVAAPLQAAAAEQMQAVYDLGDEEPAR